MRKQSEMTGFAARMLRRTLLACVLGLVLGACEGSNLFEPCDSDGDTPHTPCESTT